MSTNEHDARRARIAELVRQAPELPGSSPVEDLDQAADLDAAPDLDEGEDDAPPPPQPPIEPGVSPETVAFCAGLEQNDTDNARRLMAHFGAEIVHVREVGWHVWDGRRWRREGSDERVQDLAQRTAKLMHHEADALEMLPYELRLIERAAPLRQKDPGELSDEEVEAIKAADDVRAALGKRRVARRKWATSCGNAGRISAMIQQALPHRTAAPTDLDADPMLFNTENGTLRFSKVRAEREPGDETGDHRLHVAFGEHRREDLATKIAPVVYDPKAEAPRFLAFMDRFLPNERVRKFVQVYHGLSLTGLTGQQCFCYMYGTGANGKSTFVEAVGAIFGAYSDLLNAESLTGQGQRRGDQATPDFADLPGVRYLRISELPRGEPLKEALVKSLTGGEEIKARHLNKGFFKFTPCFKATLSGNDLPSIGGLDNGIWRRVRLVKWGVTIPDAERRPMNEVLAEFAEERSGILNWLIEGLDLYMREGLKTPPEVVEATDEYRAEMDPIEAFVQACVTTGDDGAGSYVTAREMYEAFFSWCEANSIRPWKETAFGRAMPAKGFVRENGRVRRYLNVKLHDVPPREPGTRSPSGGVAA